MCVTFCSCVFPLLSLFVNTACLEFGGLWSEDFDVRLCLEASELYDQVKANMHGSRTRIAKPLKPSQLHTQFPRCGARSKPILILRHLLLRVPDYSNNIPQQPILIARPPILKAPCRCSPEALHPDPASPRNP